MVKKDEEKMEITDAQDEYLDIYHKYFVLKWSWNEIAEYHDCSTSTISHAINWVIDNRLNIPSKHLIKGAIDSIKERIKQNNKLLKKEREKRSNNDNRFIIDLNKQIREDEKMLYELQEVYEGDKKDENGEQMSAAQVLRLIKEAGKDSEKENQ